MPSTYNDVGQNARRAQESSNFGTRKLAFYTFVCDQTYNMVGEPFNGYSFRVNGSATSNNLTVTTLGEYINPRSVLDMGVDHSSEFDYTDDGYLIIELPFSVTFNDTSYDFITIDSNSNIVFGEQATYSREGANVPDIGYPAILIANNDGYVSELYYETTGSSGSRQFRVKFLGNSNYNLSGINLVWEAVFYENSSNIDVLVTQQSTDEADYDYGFAPDGTAWGVTDGTNWIDGRSDHSVTFADFSSVVGENWKQQNSLYYRIVQTLQHANVELFWLGQPHRTDEAFVNDWSGLSPYEAEAFTFAIADDADNPKLYNEFYNDWTAIETDTDGWVLLDGVSPGWTRGQRITFSGSVFGGIVAGKTYYIKDQDGSWFQISDTVDSTNNDGTADYSANFGYPGEPAVLEPATGSMAVRQYWDDVVWEGTAGDVLWACCNDVDYKYVNATRLEDFINNIPELNNGSWWFINRAQATYGVFVAGWASN